MDFIKKFAEEQLEKQLGGNSNQQQQQHQQHQGQGYGNAQQSNYGGYNDDQQGGGQGYGGGGQGGYGGGGEQGYGGGQGYGGEEQRYGGGGQGFGGGGGGYGGEEQRYGGGGQGFGGQQGGQQFGVTGGPQYNAPHGSGGASSFMGGGGGGPNISQNEAIQAANQHAGNGNENASMFSQAFSHIQNMSQNDADIDEEDIQRKHQEAYGQGNAGNMSAGAMGSAAALQAIKQYTSGGSNAAGGQGGGDMYSKMIGMAMSEAAKMFDQSGGAASGNKQDAVTSASQTVMKLLLKNQVSGMMGGGQSGGLGSLMGMASKFM